MDRDNNVNHNDNHNGGDVVDLVATDAEKRAPEAMNGISSNSEVVDVDVDDTGDYNRHSLSNRHTPANPTDPDDGEVEAVDDVDHDRRSAAPPNHAIRNDNSHHHHHHSNSSNNTFDDSTMALRPLFFGNLVPNYSTDQITSLFEHPERFDNLPRDLQPFHPILVQRIDIKRGYCFVFLKDVTSLQEKQRVESFCMAINGINVPLISRAIRAEFARGDGRVKRIEDERRKNIAPSDTLFVVNFHENTTKKEDLELLFEPYGKLLRIDLKRNYAFVQYATIAEATAAKEATNGGKLDQSVLTVEYVAQNDNNRNSNRGPRNRYNNNNNNSNNYNSINRGSNSSINDRNRDIGRNSDRGPDSFGGGVGSSSVGRYLEVPPLSYDDRGRSIERDRGRLEYRTTGSSVVGDPYYNRATIYDNDRYSDRRASRESPPPPPPPSAPSYTYNHVRSVGRSRSRSPPPYRRRYPEELEERVVRDDYRGVGVGGNNNSISNIQYERRGSNSGGGIGGGGGGMDSDHYAPRRSSSPTDRYRYNDRENRGYR